MSCWVVPTVAAEYWGVTLDAVWGRIYGDLVPHKTEDGFVFIDVDPWSPGPGGSVFHEPPPTFVSADEAVEPLYDFDLPQMAGGPELNAAEAEFLSDDQTTTEEPGGERTDGGELPDLDDEESATFTRLSWHEVRQRVGRTRTPPRAAV